MKENEKGASCCSNAKSAPPRWHRYLPLVVLLGVTLLATLAKQIHYQSWSGINFMHDFMGLFLLIFSMLKLFHLNNFVEGFQKYDLLAQRSRGYALAYPFLELTLALGYLSHWQPQAVYISTAVLMTFGTLGIFKALAKGLDIKCACMGSSLNVPLSTVAIIEDLGMATMAVIMLIS